MGKEINKKMNWLWVYGGVNKGRKWIVEYRSKYVRGRCGVLYWIGKRKGCV